MLNIDGVPCEITSFAKRLGNTGARPLSFYDDDITPFFPPPAGKSATFSLWGAATAKKPHRSLKP